MAVVKQDKSDKTAKLDSLPRSSPEENSPNREDNLTACDEISSERYQAFVENIQEGIYEADIHGNFLYFNNSLCRIFGYHREEIQSQNFAKFMDAEQAKLTFDTFSRMYQTGQGISNLVWKINDKNSDVRVIELSANLIINKEGKKIGFRGIVRDITDKFMTQEALLKSQIRYRTLLDFVPYPIVVFNLNGCVSYLNPAFTEIFGWTFEELAGKRIPYVPPELQQETNENIKKLLEEKIIQRHESRRLTKDGRVLDVIIRGAVYQESTDEPGGQLVILRDITGEKRMKRMNEALLRISTALPEYPDLEELLDYISEEVKHLLGTEGAQVLLLDEEKKELFYLGAAHDDTAAEKRMKEIRFPANKGISGKVIRTGKPVIVPDTYKDPDFYSEVDTLAGFKTNNLLVVPLRSKDRIIGVLCARNKKTEKFDKTDIELLSMIAGSVALSIENARFSKEIQEAYKEVSTLNRSKNRVIDHLSHELKTPLSVLSGSLNILTKRLSALPRETWQPTIERAERNLDRILEIQYQVGDIMQNRHNGPHQMLSRLLDECADELESLVAEEVGEGPIVERIRRAIDETFDLKESSPQEIFLDQFVSKTLEEIKPLFSHRQVDIITHFEDTPAIWMAVDPLKKVVSGLVKNAIENTPDEGRIEIFVQRKGKGSELLICDYGVGITLDNQRRIFEGFFATQETIDYSSKQPFDFNAGGKGSDLLRMKIFSERYDFRIDMASSRCRYIPLDKDKCPGRISSCEFCREKADCHRSGGTAFTVFFPAGSKEGTPRFCAQ
jgi:PAS domain S-box-containing protein